MLDVVGTDRFGSTGLCDVAGSSIAWAYYFHAMAELLVPEPEPEQEGVWESGGVFSQSLRREYQGVDATLTRVMRGSGLVSCQRGTVRVRAFPHIGRVVGATGPVYRSVVARQPNVDRLSAVSSHRVFIPHAAEILAYLNQYHELAALLPAICEASRREFGPEAELSLELYKDPEIDDRYLTLYVRQQPYDPDIMHRIKRVTEQFIPMLETIPGYFLIATDFRKPKVRHAV